MTEVNDKGISSDLIPNLVANLDDEDKEAIVAQTVGSAPLDTRKAFVEEAVKGASPENRKAVAQQAIESLPSTERQELAMQLRPSPGTIDQVWLMVVKAFRWVLWGSALALVAAIGVALFREVDAAYVQILLTVFTTVAGIFAGFISGKALGNSTGQ